MNINDENGDQKVDKNNLIKITLPVKGSLQSLISLAGSQLVVVENKLNLTYFNLDTKQIVKWVNLKLIQVKLFQNLKFWIDLIKCTWLFI